MASPGRFRPLPSRLSFWHVNRILAASGENGTPGRRDLGLRYDACVIGAGADGLAAAIFLARAGLKAIVVEKSEQPGGRLAIRQFHPGFHAAPFTDCLAPVPTEIFHALGPAHAGVFLAPQQASFALWPDRQHGLYRHRASPAQHLLAEAARATQDACARAERDAESPAKKPLLGRAPKPAPWPGEDRFAAALADLVARAVAEPDAAAHVMARVLEGRVADPFARGSAFHLLAPAGAALIVPGLAEALVASARAAGVEILCGAEASEIRQAKNRIAAVALADGTQIEARAVLSSLDLKRSFLSLFPWDALPKTVSHRVGAFRMAGATARLLLALDRPPTCDAELLRAPLHIAPDPARMAGAAASWRAGTVPDHPPLTLRVTSANAPALAPAGQAVMTATLGAIPARLFDGAWTHDKRDRLRDATLAAIETALPGTRETVLAAELLVPPDIEEALGVTGGDLWGGEIASDQMFSLRPGFDTPAPRTPIEGLYLAGASTASGVLGACASGVIAAQAMIGDLKAGRLK
jgi:phytoene dehydrogenase-like protein